MAAGSSTLCIAATPGSATQFLCSRSPLPSCKISRSHVRLPLSRLTRASSLVASEMSERESVDLWKMETAFSSLLLNVEESFDHGEADRLGVEQICRAPWHILETGRGEGEDPKQGCGVTAPVVWRDASLRYANVMWFKGAYNVEILCGEDEPEDSIVRRFRQAVSRAGVIRECHRRRYLEAPQDTIKRKLQTAAFNRRRSRQPSNPSKAWTQNAWKLSTENFKPVDHSKKKKSPRKNYERPRFDATTKGSSDKKVDVIDDDYWGYQEDRVEEQPKRS